MELARGHFGHEIPACEDPYETLTNENAAAGVLGWQWAAHPFSAACVIRTTIERHSPMRTALAATAFTALALFTAAPTALAHDGGGGAPEPARQAERLMQAADKFDKKAGSMRARAGRLRATALELRLEAEELAGNEAPDPTGKSGRQGSSMTTTTTTTTTITTGDNGPAGPPPAEDGGSKGDDGSDESFADPNGCAWDGEDDLGFSREHDAEPPKGDDASANGEEICHLLRMADRLEQRAGALDAAAARMQSHATKLRERAAKLLGEGGASTAERMLKKAAAFRQAATKLRAEADAARDAAFEGTDVDDETVSRIRRMELKAAAFDARADRLEARAATLVS